MIWWPSEFPTIQYGQFTLRPLSEVHIEPIFQSCQDPLIPQFTTVPADYTLDMAESFVNTTTKQLFTAHKSMVLAFTISKSVSPRAIMINDETFLGTIGIHGIEEDNHIAEIGYWLNKEIRGNGFATVGIKMLTNFAFESIGFRRLAGLVDSNNEASKKALLGAGYQHEGLMKSRVTRADGRQIDMDLFAATSEY